MTTLSLILVVVFALSGTAFALLAAVGIVRMPDLFTRMQAGSKGSTLGAICLLLTAALHFGTFDAWIRALLVALFLMLTTPIAAHMIGRAGYLSGVRLSSETHLDELDGRYDKKARKLL